MNTTLTAFGFHPDAHWFRRFSSYFTLGMLLMAWVIGFVAWFSEIMGPADIMLGLVALLWPLIILPMLFVLFKWPKQCFIVSSVLLLAVIDITISAKLTICFAVALYVFGSRFKTRWEDRTKRQEMIDNFKRQPAWYFFIMLICFFGIAIIFLLLGNVLLACALLISPVILIPIIRGIYSYFAIPRWGRDFQENQIFYAELPVWQGLVNYSLETTQQYLHAVRTPLRILITLHNALVINRVGGLLISLFLAFLVFATMIWWVMILTIIASVIGSIAIPRLYDDRLKWAHSKMVLTNGDIVSNNLSYTLFGGFSVASQQGKATGFDAGFYQQVRNVDGNWWIWNPETIIRFAYNADPVQSLEYLQDEEGLGKPIFVHQLEELLAFLDRGTGYAPPPASVKIKGKTVPFVAFPS